MPAITKFQARRGTAAAWSSANPILADGELGWDSTNAKVKVGDGVTNWNTLPYLLAQELLLKAPLASPTFTGTVSGITKSMVGLGNVDNTSDANKPLSTIAETRVNTLVAEKLGEVSDATSAELILTPDRVTGPTGLRLNLPTHITANTTGEATHPSVAYRPDGWNGYPYWMAFTPYQGANDSMEDPNIVASMDGITWVVPAGLTNPLNDAPGSPSHYNSDTDLTFGPDDKLYCFWRNYDPAATGAQEKLYYRSSSDGVTWGATTLVMSASDSVQRYLSPCFIFEGGAWTCWYLDMMVSPYRIVRMRSTGKDPLNGTWGAPVPVTYSAGPPTPYRPNASPWHLGVVKAYGRYHMLVADNDTVGTTGRQQIYMTSPDGKAWLSAMNGCIPRIKTGQHDSMYRATMVPSIQRGVFGLRVWYGAFLSTSNPQQWHVYRTFITDGPRIERGSFTDNVPAASSASAPSFIQRYITFSREFKYVPDMVLTSETGFLSPAPSSITTTGFYYNVDNTVQAAKTNAKFYWTATEPLAD